MYACWQEYPESRPSFDMLVNDMDKMLTSSLKDEVSLVLYTCFYVFLEMAILEILVDWIL